MFYWFERGSEYARYEARKLPSGAYELTIYGPDGTQHIEHFETSGALSARERAFQKELESQGWTGPHGWNL